MNEINENKPQITCIGLCNVDVIANVSDEFIIEHNITKGATTDLDACAVGNILSKLDTPVMTAGGCAANTAFGVSQHGIETKFIGKTGDDSYADIFRSDFKNGNVSFTTTPYFAAMTSTCLIMVTPDKERSFALCTNTAGWKLSDKDLSEITNDAGQYVYIEANIAKIPSSNADNLLLFALDKYCGGERKVIINLNDMQIIRDTKESLLRTLDMKVFFYICNIHELSELFDAETHADALKSAQEANRNFVVTDGDKGAYIVPKGSEDILHIPANIVPQSRIINTAGAGDQFAAGFISGIATGKSLSEAAQMGMNDAAKVIQRESARLKKRS